MSAGSAGKREAGDRPFPSSLKMRTSVRVTFYPIKGRLSIVFFVDRWGIQKTGDDAPHPFRCRPRPELHLRACSLLHPGNRSEEHTSELQSRENLVCRLLLEKKKKKRFNLLTI